VRLSVTAPGDTNLSDVTDNNNNNDDNNHDDSNDDGATAAARTTTTNSKCELATRPWRRPRSGPSTVTERQPACSRLYTTTPRALRTDYRPHTVNTSLTHTSAQIDN